MTYHTLDKLHEDIEAALADVADGTPVLVEHQGKALCAIISINDLSILSARLEEMEDRIDHTEAAEALAEIAREGTIPYEQVRRELGLTED